MATLSRALPQLALRPATSSASLYTDDVASTPAPDEHARPGSEAPDAPEVAEVAAGSSIACSARPPIRLWQALLMFAMPTGFALALIWSVHNANIQAAEHSENRITLPWHREWHGGAFSSTVDFHETADLGGAISLYRQGKAGRVFLWEAELIVAKEARLRLSADGVHLVHGRWHDSRLDVFTNGKPRHQVRPQTLRWYYRLLPARFIDSLTCEVIDAEQRMPFVVGGIDRYLLDLSSGTVERDTAGSSLFVLLALVEVATLITALAWFKTRRQPGLMQLLVTAGVVVASWSLAMTL